MTPTPVTWGPDARRAAVSVRFAGLAVEDEGTAVSPALPQLLSLLGTRRLRATFFVDAEIAASEPFALTMLSNAGHEIGALLDLRAPSGDVLAAVEAAGHAPVGASGGRVDADAIAELGAHPSVRYLSVPGEGIATLGDLVRIGFDPGAATEPVADARLGAEAAAEQPAPPGPHDWHPAMQLAVTRALEHRRHATLSFTLAALERGDAIGAFAETLDLVSGLTRAERLWVPTLGELADWWRTRAAGTNA